jgi:hypothetical protein
MSLSRDRLCVALSLLKMHIYTTILHSFVTTMTVLKIIELDYIALKG